MNGFQTAFDDLLTCVSLRAVDMAVLYLSKVSEHVHINRA